MVIIKSIAWFVMTVLALGVAGYAIAMLFVSELRPSLVKILFTEIPIIAVAHFAGGAISLAVGAFGFNTQLRKRFLGVHRWLGRLYVMAVFFGGIASFLLALRANGGLIAQWGFAVPAVLWLGSTFHAYRQIRGGNLSAHQDWMMRSYALTLSAVTLRFYLPASQIADIPIQIALPIIAWAAWLPNLLIAEWFIQARRLRSPLATLAIQS